MYVHAFGAYFGLTVAKVLHHRDLENENEGSNYNSDLFSMIGNLYLNINWSIELLHFILRYFIFMGILGINVYRHSKNIII